MAREHAEYGSAGEELKLHVRMAIAELKSRLADLAHCAFARVVQKWHFDAFRDRRGARVIFTDVQMLVPLIDKLHLNIHHLPVAPSTFDVVRHLEGARFTTVLGTKHTFLNIERVRGEADGVGRPLSHLIVHVVDMSGF